MPFTLPNTAAATYPNQARPDSGDFTVIQQGVNAEGVLSGCAVAAQGTPNMTVAVAAGIIRIGGAYVSVSSANPTVTANSSGSTRIDLVAVNSSGTVSVLAGTAAGLPVWPSSSGYVVLARLEVPNGAASIAAGNITDKRMLIGVPDAPRVTFSNVNYTAASTDRLIAQTGTLSAARYVTLPLANSVPAGAVLTLVDESGTALYSSALFWLRAGSDTINGQAGVWLAADCPYGMGRIESDGVSKWTTLESTSQGFTVMGNADYTLQAYHREIVVGVAPTANRNLILPSVASMPNGAIIVAVASVALGGFTIFWSPQTGDNINGATGTTAAITATYTPTRIMAAGGTTWLKV